MQENKWNTTRTGEFMVSATDKDITLAKAAIEREAIGAPRDTRTTLSNPQPTPLKADAYHGVLGEIVRAIDPHTEASKEAILYSGLALLGNYVGRGPRSIASGSSHTTNDYIMLVGPTGAGRKGSAMGHWRNLMRGWDVSEGIDPDWCNNNIVGGLSSGEGLVYHLRDEMVNKDGVVIDEGVKDKRKLIYETEAASMFQVMERRGNTLSAQMRSAWDDGYIQVLTKNSPVKASDAHASLLGHITPEELVLLMPDVQCANGYGNRYLYCWSLRSKYLPDGGGLPQWGQVVGRLRSVLNQARKPHLYTRDEEATRLWEDIYRPLSDAKGGLAGSLTARNEAHALRLQILYACLDNSTFITTDHVLASVEIVRYSSDTVRYVFGDKTGNKDADRILVGLKERGFMTRTLISTEIFQGNLKADRITTAMDLLLNGHYIVGAEKEVEGGNLMSGYEAIN